MDNFSFLHILDCGDEIELVITSFDLNARLNYRYGNLSQYISGVNDDGFGKKD